MLRRIAPIDDRKKRPIDFHAPIAKDHQPMSDEIPMYPTSAKRPIAIIISVVAALIAILGLLLASRPAALSPSPTVSALIQIVENKTLRVGYELYPPYTIKDPSTGKLTGFSVDLADYIAREAGWKVEWIQTSPGTKIPDLQAGKFDVMTEPIFRTIPRATQVCFSRPYAYFGDAAGIVKRGDARFNVIEDLNKKGVTIAVRQGYTDQTFAADNLPNASIRALNVDDVSQLFVEVVAGKADVALADLEQVKAFAAAHVGEVEARFVDPAPSYIPAGLMLRQGDFTFYNFLNVSLEYMEANGDISRLNHKNGISASPPPASR
jgi:polar amino acid transport system substrate-binding protein